MSFELKMPKLGESVTEGTIGKWLKKPGDKVNKYDLLVEVQTDKVNTEIPSQVSGTLKEIKVQEGETVAIGTVLALFDTADESAAASAAGPGAATEAPAPRPAAAQQAPQAAPQQARDAQPSAARPAPQPAAAPQTRQPAPAPSAGAPQSQPAYASAAAARPSGGNGQPRADLSDVRATPAVRKLASENGIDISEIEGTGLGGRVSRKDVEDFIAQQGAASQKEAPQAQRAAPEQQAQRATPPQQAAAAQVVPAQSAPQPSRPSPAPSLAGDTLVPLTQMRRAIANNMVQAWSAPHAHAVMPVDVTELMKYRETVRHDFAAREGFDLSPAAFIAKAVIEALRAVPQANASWTDQGLVLHREINLGYAVALGEEGLIVPVIKDADGRSLAGLMRSIRDVVDRAKAKRLTLDDLTGGTFTLNNTGPLGTIVSSPIVPPGQAAIMSSESIQKALTVTKDDSIAIRQIMNIVIGFDHRVIDGSTAARFLTAVRNWLQDVGPSVTVY